MVRFPGCQACWFAQVEAPEANDASETAKVQPRKRKHVMVSYAWKKIDSKGAPALLAVAAADGTRAVAQAACVRARAACGRFRTAHSPAGAAGARPCIMRARRGMRGAHTRERRTSG